MVILMSFTFISFSDYEVVNAQENKIYSKATINDEFADDRVLVVLNEEYKNKNYSKNDFESIDCVNLIEYDFDCSNDILRIDLSEKSKSNVLSVSEELLNRDDVLYAGPDFKMSLYSTESNDTFSSSQWSLDSIGLQDSWDFSTGTSEVLVGIADSGIDGTHPDLSGSIVRTLCRDFTSGTEVSTPNPTDPLGHGTHVAGIIGAIGNNNVGVTGANWNVGLVSLRVFDEYGYGYSSNLIKAISYADQNDISILNFSGGWTDDHPYYDIALDSSIQNYDGIIICAAGNSHVNIDENSVYPATINLSNIITVGSINDENERSFFSNYGSTSVDIYAPGSEILSTYPSFFCNNYNYVFNDGTRLCELSTDMAEMIIELSEDNDISMEYIDDNFSEIFIFSDGVKRDPADCIACAHESTGYHYMDGTSMATPYVTGVAALLLSINENLTASQLKNAIMNSAEIITITVPDTSVTAEEGDTINQTVRKLNAYNAVKYILNNYSSATTLKFNTKSLSKSVDSTSTFFNEKNYFLKMNVENAFEYDFTISSSSALEITLYDSDFNKINVSQTSTNGGLTKTFSYYLSVGTYYLQSNYVSSTASGTINVSIVGEPHTHSYTMQYYNYKWHKLTCECGQTTGSTQVHTILQSEIVNGRYAECIGCHHLLDLNSDMALVGGINSASVTQVSVNGSYILPSGIIVLVDEDLDAYLNGTLVFYDKDKVSVLQ